MTYSLELRLKKPSLGLKTDYENSRKAAIELFCLDCVGGERKIAVSCSCTSCPLWQFRPGAIKGVKPDGIPTKEQYLELTETAKSPAQVAHGKKLAKMRWEKKLEKDLEEL